MGDLLKKARDAARAKRFAEAAAILESLLGEDPQNLRALDLAGYVEFFRGNPQRAEEHCRRALEIRPDHAYALSGLGSSLSRQGRLDEALESFERAIAVKPDWFEPWFDMAVALDRARRRERALEVLERARERFPEESFRIDELADRIRSKIE